MSLNGPMIGICQLTCFHCIRIQLIDANHKSETFAASNRQEIHCYILNQSLLERSFYARRMILERCAFGWLCNLLAYRK